jgi:DNA polymerase-4
MTVRWIHVGEPQKSFSKQETFARDLTDEGYADAVLRRMADHLFADVRAEGRSVRTLTVKVRYNDMAEDQVSESLHEPTDLETDLYGRLHTMLVAAWKRRVSLRLVSLNQTCDRASERAAAGNPAQRRKRGAVGGGN